MSTRLLTGRFQVRILVAEPRRSRKWLFRSYRFCSDCVRRTTRVKAGRFHVRILVADALNSKSAFIGPAGCSRGSCRPTRLLRASTIRTKAAGWSTTTGWSSPQPAVRQHVGAVRARAPVLDVGHRRPSPRVKLARRRSPGRVDGLGNFLDRQHVRSLARLIDEHGERVEVLGPRARLYLSSRQYDLAVAVARQALRQLSGDRLRRTAPARGSGGGRAGPRTRH